jgi:glyoxylase-like metal-dependent hydrolase (beta-lactamase superfamily II)
VKITGNIYSIPAPTAFYTGPQAPNVFLIEDEGVGALIDSGFGDDASVKARLEYLRGHPEIRLRYILLTHHHFDHTGGASRIREATGAQIVLHPMEEAHLLDWQGDAPQDVEIPMASEELREQVQELRKRASEAAPPDLPMAGGGMLSVGGLTIEIIHTPGHTMGSICLYVREEKVLFTGDTALGLGTVAISPPPNGDMGLYLESLRMLQRYEVELMLPGHGRPVENVEAKLQELIDHRRERERQVFKLLRAGKSTPRSMLGAIYPELDRRIIPMALRQIEAHLAKLAEEGVVEDMGGGEWKLRR